jgi:predicted 3-demethylubiquinone-9 3-methyltransferase (glyoxalase superfamily)
VSSLFFVDKISWAGVGQCGWLKDKYGLSWQVVPDAMEHMMSTGTKEQIGRVTQAFLQMKKFDIAALEAAFTAS